MATEKKFSIKVEIEKSIESVNKFKDSLANIPGPIGGVVQGLGGLTSAARAFIATPIGAIVAALGAVFMALKKGIESSERATQGLNRIMGAFNGIIGPIVRSIGLLAEKLIDGVVYAMEAVMDAAEAMGLSFAENARAGMALAQSLNEIEEAEGDLEVARAQQNQTLAQAREILSDTNATYAERKDALDKVRAAEEALGAKEVELARKRVAAAQENIRLNGASKEANDQLDAALIKLAGTEQELASKRRLFNKEDKKLIAETEAKAKEAADKARENAEKFKAQEQEKLKIRQENAAYERRLLIEQIKDEKKQKTAQVIEDANLARLAAESSIKDRQLLKKRFELIEKEAAIKLSKINEEYLEKTNKEYVDYQDSLLDKDLSEKERSIRETEKYYAKLYEKIEAGSQGITSVMAIGWDEQNKQYEVTAMKRISSYDEEIDSDEARAKKKAEIQERERKEIEAINEEYDKKQANKELEKLAKSEAAQKSAYEKELYLLDENAADYDQQKKAIEDKRTQDEIANLEKRIKILKDGGKATADELIAAEEEYYAKLNELREKDLADQKAASEKKKQTIIQGINGALTAATEITNAISAIQDMQMQKELNAAGENLEKQEAIKRKYFEKNKKVQIAQAIIAAIQGAVGAFTSLSAIPVVGPILGGIAAAAALASGYANVQKIRNTNYESANGGDSGAGGGGGSSQPMPSKFARGGVLQGRKHAEGGVATPFGELEGGEYVINRQATASFLPLLDKINSMGGGSGAPNNLSSQAESIVAPPPVIKTYVVASDVASAMEANKRIADMARL